MLYTDSLEEDLIDTPLWTFDSIVEFLQWYGSWSERLNVDEDIMYYSRGECELFGFDKPF